MYDSLDVEQKEAMLTLLILSKKQDIINSVWFDKKTNDRFIWCPKCDQLRLVVNNSFCNTCYHMFV